MNWRIEQKKLLIDAFGLAIDYYLTIYNICVNIFEKRGNKGVIDMSQLAIYIDEKLAEKLEKAVKVSGKSKSKWVAGAIERSLQEQWPDGFFDLAGSWDDDVGPDEIMNKIRNRMEKTEWREKSG